MKSSTFLAFAILEAAFLCEAVTTLLQCNADNCLRAMTNTPSVASSMCNTYIASTTVTTVTPTVTVSFTNTIFPAPPPTIPAHVIPSHISSQCVLATPTALDARISSACSCISVSPTTVTSTALAAAVTTVIDPPTACDLSNIQGDGGTYTINGMTYNIECNMEPSGYRPITLAFVPDFGQCIAACTTTGGCIGVFWDPTGSYDGSTYCGLSSDIYSPLISSDGVSVAYLSSYTLESIYE